MKKTNGESNIGQAGADFKGWMPPANWWERPKMLSSLMTFYLCRPGGIAWSEAFSIAKKYGDMHGTKQGTEKESDWRSHAKWLVNPKRRHNFDLTIKEVDEHIQVLHKSDRPLGQKEIRTLIERIGGAKRHNPDRGARRSRRGLPGTAPVRYAPKDYDIGDGSGYVYAYYLPEYRKNKNGQDFRIKIGCSINYSDRINAQATGQPEKLKLSVLWRTDEPETAERLLHGLLKFRGKHLSDAPGTEWFLTSPHEIIQIIECIQPGVRIRPPGLKATI